MGLQTRQRGRFTIINNLDSNLLGRSSEDLAANYILSLGWPILARNVKNQYGELDIIAIDSKSNPEELVIIEVRARTTGKIQSAIDSIGPHKLRTLIKAGREVVNLLNWSGFWRIDVAGITFHDKNDLTNWTLEHVRDITAGMNLLS